MIYGQEMNRTTYNLARMNMILHDVHFAKFDIKQEDTLTRPQHIDHVLKQWWPILHSQQNGQQIQYSYKMNVLAVLETCAKLKSRYGFCSAHASSTG
jgi:hypothetical protein